MTWLLLIQVVTVFTCVEGYRFCSPTKPPVETRHVLKTQEACEKRAEHYRRYFPAERELTRTAHLTMRQQTTVRCVPQTKG